MLLATFSFSIMGLCVKLNSSSFNEYELVFYQNKITSRWWIEIIGDGSNNKLKQNTLLPCTLDDYEVAKSGMIPERWFKAIKKNVL